MNCYSLQHLDVGSIFAIIIPFTHSKNITCRILNVRYHKTLTIFTLPIIHLVYSPKFCARIVSNFSLVLAFVPGMEFYGNYLIAQNLCFKVRQSVKPLIRNCFLFFIPMQINFFFQERFSIVFKVRVVLNSKMSN